MAQGGQHGGGGTNNQNKKAHNRGNVASVPSPANFQPPVNHQGGTHPITGRMPSITEYTNRPGGRNG